MKAAQKQANNKSNHSTTEATQTSWQSQLAQVANNSEEAVAQRALIAGISDSPRILAQRLQIESYIGTGQQQSSIHSALPITQPPIQRLEKPDNEEKELLQRKPNPESTIQLEQQSAPNPNNTGLPNNLKSSIESLSGLSMDSIKVHYNSPQPAQLNALAYARGTDIHIAPGQEQHLPHEAWHVVQQAQGRVRPTMQMKNGAPVNDDKGLEYEADVMGERAIEMMKGDAHNARPVLGADKNVTQTAQLPIVQPKWIQPPKNPIYMWDEVIGAFRWYFNSLTNKMFFRIENAEELSEEDYARLINFNNIEFSYDEWVEKGWGIGKWAEGDNEVIPSWKLKLNRMIEKANLLVEMGVLATSPNEKGIARSYWGEALNPKHRPVEGHNDPKAQVNLREIYAKDEEAQLRFNFYDWLDSKGVPVGDQVIYMDENMRKQYAVTISGTKIAGGGISEKHRDHAFVLSTDGVIYAAPKQTSGEVRIHHSSFMAGGAVACAGIFFVQPGGNIFYVKDYSGHYQPGIPELKRLKKYLVGIGSGDMALWKLNGKVYKGAIKDWPED
ncbi:MAG: eCIS core domain-containing protein [Methylobacter sp.]